MPRRTKEEALVTRHRILDAAETLFERRGVSRTSLNDIAQAAEVTRGAIYWHFKDKADLFSAMMDRVILPMEQAMACSEGVCEIDPIDFLHRRAVMTLQLTARDPQMRRVMEISNHKVEYVDELLSVRDRHLQGRNECLAECERAFRLATRHGTLGTRVPARTAALGLHAIIDGLVRNWMLDPDAFDLVKVGRVVISSYLDGMRPAPAAGDTQPTKDGAAAARSQPAVTPPPAAAEAARRQAPKVAAVPVAAAGNAKKASS